MSISSAPSRTRRRLAAAAAGLWLAGSAPSLGVDRDGYGRDPDDLESWLARLVAAYPDTVAGFDDSDLVLADGTRIALSDGREDKSFDELLDAPDIGDMFAFAYPAGEPAQAPPRNFDPGRVRSEKLFRALYGDCREGEVADRMRGIAWVPKHGGGTVTITTAQGADEALERVSSELDRLPASFGKYLVPSSGTYNCRTVAGTDRMSMHAYGAAIDINARYAHYWLWSKPEGGAAWTNKVPAEIVAIFEKHGFIWGGRWHHFDTMHFEFRPELLPPGT